MSPKTRFLCTLLLLVFILYSCKTNKTVNHERVGKWIYKDTVNGILIKSKGRYEKSVEIKTWKYFENRKLVKIEKYKDGICHIKTFDSKGKVSSIGQSMMVEEKDGTHWYIVGKWLFYNTNGKIVGVREYEKGELISEEILD